MNKDFRKISEIKSGSIQSKTKIKYDKGKSFIIETEDMKFVFYKKGKFWFDGKNDEKVKLEIIWVSFECDSCNENISKKIYNLRERQYILCNNCNSFFASHSCERKGDKNPMSCKSIQERFGFNKKEAEEYFSKILSDAKISGSDKNTRKYWLNKGYSEDETTKILARKRPQSKHHWLNKGYSEDEAIYKARSNNASTLEYYQERKYENAEKSRSDFIKQHNSNTLENFKEKYGNELGEEKYFKWKSDSAENNKFKGYSIISQKLFWSLYKILREEYEHIYFKKLNKEYNLRSDKKLYCYDFAVFDNKKIIEFNGDYWHANPDKYQSEDIVYESVSAKDIWIKDEIKNGFAESKGFDVMVIWENEYKEDEEDCIGKCLSFLRS